MVVKRRLSFVLWCLAGPAWGHHTRDHAMLAEDPQRVVEQIRQGTGGEFLGLAWGAVILLLVLGGIRWWRGRS